MNRQGELVVVSDFVHRMVCARDNFSTTLVKLLCMQVELLMLGVADQWVHHLEAGEEDLPCCTGLLSACPQRNTGSGQWSKSHMQDAMSHLSGCCFKTGVQGFPTGCCNFSLQYLN